MTTAETCNDNRFELINHFKKKLIEATNIESSPDEMAVLDNILFRCWQMGWLDAISKNTIKRKIKDGNYAGRCNCGKFVFKDQNFCPICGQALEWGDS